MIIDGQTYAKMSPVVSRNHGIEVIYQEYNLIPSLTVAENICLGSKMHGLSNRKEMIKTTQEILDKYEIDIDPRAYVKDLSPAKQQLVEITKAISKDAKIIVMDEPTAQLTLSEVEKLYEIIRNLKKKDCTIIYISHRLDELFAITDCIVSQLCGTDVM